MFPFKSERKSEIFKSFSMKLKREEKIIFTSKKNRDCEDCEELETCVICVGEYIDKCASTRCVHFIWKQCGAVKPVRC